ncbi:hypothetical protein KGQ34_01720 [Patescibacteria group bacterium]|nr:hypothetical protein [Patescibacteria group bacterium]
MNSFIVGLFFLLFLGLQFGSQWILLYLAVGSLISVPLALLFKEAVEENTNDAKPATLRNSIKRHFANYLKNIDPIERLTLELSLPLVVLFSAIYIAVTWLPLLAENICLHAESMCLRLYILYRKLALNFLFWRLKRKFKKIFLYLHIALSEEEKNKPETRALLEHIRLILKKKT